MIVKDEEKYLGRCLDSVKGIADEIIIADTGSTDRTKEIAGKYTYKIFDFKWADDFAAARNFSISKATGDWILVLDADEVVDGASAKKIRNFMESGADGAIITKKEYRKSERWAGFIPSGKNDALARGYLGFTATPTLSIFRRRKEIFFEGQVHETVGKSISSAGLKIADAKDIFIHHYKEDKGDENFRQRQLSYMAILKKMIEKNPGDARAHYKLAGIYNAILNDKKKALEHIKHAYRLGYNEKYCLESIGILQLSIGEKEEAEKTFINALGKGISSPVIYHKLGKIYLEKKDYRRAKIVLEELVKRESVYRDNALRILKAIK